MICPNCEDLYPGKLIPVDKNFNCMDCGKPMKELYKEGRMDNMNNMEAMEAKVDRVTCKDCLWFKKAMEDPFRRIHECRKDNPAHTGWPKVYTYDWCGQLKEI